MVMLPLRRCLASAASKATPLSKPEGTSNAVLELAKGVLAGERGQLARAITLVESQNPRKRERAHELLETILRRKEKPSSGGKHASVTQAPKSFRIGLSGPPGAGKSTFLEVFGKFLTARGHRVAVLAVDPSSSFTGGSLLGDKTRMPELSQDKNAYIRPSPTSGTLGGVAQNTSEAVILCEAAGYDIVLVETVGVGQSEYAVSNMVDMFVLLIPPAGGDELQGLKRGIVEMADLIVVSKADGDLHAPAIRMQTEYKSALRVMRPYSELWNPKVLCISAIQSDGIESLWKTMEKYREKMNGCGRLATRRENQRQIWLWNHIEHQLLSRFKRHAHVETMKDGMESAVRCGRITPGMAAHNMLDAFFGTTRASSPAADTGEGDDQAGR
ncbi:methylmalonic aciduria type A homolog, mitochondrial-like [Sycon ciliatum]|uniref:methylmalonic aciduria type A homolog, mitochondrial-like n=1 Tax=Sycon ciliatum TaxID=27933 RepID=UPI0031F6E4B7